MKGKEALGKKIKRALDINDLVPERDLIEMRGMSELTARECESIVHYSEENIKLALREYLLNIEGKGMLCTSYLGKIVRVEGEICALMIEKRWRR